MLEIVYHIHTKIQRQKESPKQITVRPRSIERGLQKGFRRTHERTDGVTGKFLTRTINGAVILTTKRNVNYVNKQTI